MRTEPTYDNPEYVPNTGGAMLLLPPRLSGERWGIAVDGFPDREKFPQGHPDVTWWSNRCIGQIRMPEEFLREFVKHAGRTLGMTVIDNAATPIVVDLTDEVPVTRTGLPEFAEPTTSVEPKTERWK